MWNNVGRQDDERSGTSGEIKLKKVGYLRCEHLLPMGGCRPCSLACVGWQDEKKVGKNEKTRGRG
jgi:hypothetical protein